MSGQFINTVASLHAREHLGKRLPEQIRVRAERGAVLQSARLLFRRLVQLDQIAAGV